MRNYIIISIFLVFGTSSLRAQWETGGAMGVSFPVTGYGGVVKTGWMARISGDYKFGKGLFATGLDLNVARFAKDKTSTDQWDESKLTLISFLFPAEFEFNRKSKLTFYISPAIGLSIYVFSYNSGVYADDASITNVSFTLAPSAGVRYKFSNHLFLDMRFAAIYLTDGPPVGFPKSDQATGYNAISAGIKYRF